jgi:D-serine deaminase-like pyridoxal phosphate-dependent protein
MVAANAEGATASIVVDSPAQLEPLAHAAREAGVVVPVVIDVDVSYRPLGGAVHVGVRRSPLRSPAAVIALARRIAETRGVRLDGVMTYEAHIAGLPDNAPDGGLTGMATRAVKRMAQRALVPARQALADALETAGFTPRVFNGGGTGSVLTTPLESAVTEVTVGSGFVDSHLFDHYTGLALQPALFFGVQVVRMPTDRIVTCHGAGYVQTPVQFANAHGLALGDPVFFRHAKAGELAERVTHYLFVRGDRVVSREPTYRGLGACFV